MNYFANKEIGAVLRVIAVSVDNMPLYAQDGDRVHVWLTCDVWSNRRAFLTGGDQFLHAFLAKHGFTPEQIAQLRSARSAPAVKALAKTMVDKFFHAMITFPSDAAQANEHIEISGLQLLAPGDQEAVAV